MRLCVSSYSFAAAIRTGQMTQFDTVAAARDLGFSAIEFTDLVPEQGKVPTQREQMEFAARLREEAERLDMRIAAYAIGANLSVTGEAAEAEIARLAGQIDVCWTLGAPLLRHDVCYSVGKARTFDALLPTLVENVRRVTAYAASLGIRTCTENHGFVAQDSDRIERLVTAVGHPNYGALIDVGNFACADEDSAAAVSRLAPLAMHVHAKDFVFYPFAARHAGGIETRACNRIEPCAVGDGNIPVEQCLAILRRAGYDGYVSVEFEGRGDCIDGIRRGKEALLRYGVEQ